MKELEIIKGLLPEMTQVMNAVQGAVYTNKEAETLLIMQRRLPASDMQRELVKYNGIFAKQRGCDIEDIADSVVSYLKIKVLCEAELTDFDGKSLRDFIKECKTYIDKITNIIRLSKTHIMTADAYQKEKISQTISKNEALILALENQIEIVEKQIERIPKPVFIEEPENEDEEEVLVEKPEKVTEAKTGVSIGERLGKMIHAKKDRQEIENHLKEVEKEASDTDCKEIPFYDRVLVATEVVSCRDFDCYVLLKRKDNIYFGLRNHLKGNSYDNSDQSLMELTQVTEEFLQLMTSDILSDEYVLRPFTFAEKKGMQMYFNFVSKCFEKHIGSTLTVAEYLGFKRYYNRLVCQVQQLEEKDKHDYYRALPIAEQYILLMESYNMVQSESKGQIVKAIIAMDHGAYIENLGLIMQHHIVDEKAKEEVEQLMEQMLYFDDEGHFTQEKEAVESHIEVSQTGISMNPMGFLPQIPMYQPGMMPMIGNMYFTLQCLNEEKEIIDEAHFSAGNMTQAMQDYNNRQAYIKRFGLVQDGRFLPLMSSEKGDF